MLYALFLFSLFVLDCYLLFVGSGGLCLFVVCVLYCVLCCVVSCVSCVLFIVVCSVIVRCLFLLVVRCSFGLCCL